MALTIFDRETNRNAVIMWYQGPGIGQHYEGERPYGCTVRFHGYNISATIYEKGFRVFKKSKNLSKRFPTLREARNFIIDRVNKKCSLFR